MTFPGSDTFEEELEDEKKDVYIRVRDSEDVGRAKAWVVNWSFPPSGTSIRRYRVPDDVDAMNV